MLELVHTCAGESRPLGPRAYSVLNDDYISFPDEKEIEVTNAYIASVF